MNLLTDQYVNEKSIALQQKDIINTPASKAVQKKLMNNLKTAKPLIWMEIYRDAIGGTTDVTPKKASKYSLQN